jgi:hypothetical protein
MTGLVDLVVRLRRQEHSSKSMGRPESAHEQFAGSFTGHAADAM